MKSWQEEPPALHFPALHRGEPRITRFIFELGFLGKEAKENKLMSGVYVIKQFPRSALGPLRFSPTPSDDPGRGRGRGGPRGRRASTPGQGGGAEDPDPPDGRHRLPCEATKDARGPSVSSALSGWSLAQPGRSLGSVTLSLPALCQLPAAVQPPRRAASLWVPIRLRMLTCAVRLAVGVTASHWPVTSRQPVGRPTSRPFLHP